MCVVWVLLVLVAAPDSALSAFNENGYKNKYKSIGGAVLPSGCLYEGAWYRNGGSVSTGEACLHCTCGGGALTCRRRACAPLPEPPPARCHVIHRRGSCCPELHCPDGVRLLEHGASARFENTDSEISSTSLSRACVEGGTVYAAGSAMKSSLACEQCFCLGGARRCVRPTCLPPPPGCKPRPAPGACCPQRYYCEHRTTKPPEERHPHDCKVDGKWIVEGEKVVSSKSKTMNCTQCFCLRGAVQCQPLSCAPPLLGCKPLLRPGECCAHQYVCDRSKHGLSESRILTLSSVVHTSARNNNHIPKTSNSDSTTKTTLASVYNLKNTHTTSTKNHLVGTTKVKRKTNDPPPEASSKNNVTVIEDVTATTREPTTEVKPTTTDEPSTTELTTEITSTEQPEGSIRIMINGTINCTAELSSTSLPLNMSVNDTNKIKMESLPRIPLIDVSNLEDHTFSANDIITDRTVNGDFDENESFVINVTSSLMTNKNVSKTTTKAPAPTVTKISLPVDIAGALNGSKKTKGDYDYDYTHPTLPPSLPNLKIIPFVAADAVVEEDHSKETLTYPILEREDKFPIYYPTADSKNIAFANRREDTYHSTQYPVFITDKTDSEYPSIAQDVDLTSTGYSNSQPELGTSINEYTVSATLGNQINDNKKVVTQRPPVTTTFKLETPAVNLFSPPIETEGGFVPKGPGIIDEYYAVFPSTPGPLVPHLTTSMQLDVVKGECLSSDGRRVPDGETISFACSECRCAWGELHCSPRPCRTPPGCRRRPASTGTGDLCCGDLICDEDSKPTQAPNSTTKSPNVINATENKTVYNITTAPIEPENVTANENKILKVNVPIINHNKTKPVETSNKLPEEINSDKDKKATTTEKLTTNQVFSTTTPVTVVKETDAHNNSSEYEDEDEDEGFSFGSVLKLLLSESYDTTTVPPKKSTTKIVTSSKAPLRPVTTTRRPRPPLAPIAPKPTVAPFVPLPPYIPSKLSHNPINRIDHLVLGESTAIKKTTTKPVSTTLRPTTIAPKPVIIEEKHTTQEGPRPPGPTGLSGVGPGLLKLAGCNIYGRMYRVGRIIAELSTPCQECWCTEFGVQCKQLKC